MDNQKNELDQLERELREGLAAKAAPDGFSQRVMARLDASPSLRSNRPRAWFPSMHWPALAVLAAVLLAVIAGGQWERQREQRIAGERARAQVILALHITASTLNAVQQKIQQSGREIHP